MSRPHDQGYSVRAIVKADFFYALNYEADRWPSGNPQTGYLDTNGGPTKTEILEANRKGKYHSYGNYHLVKNLLENFTR